MAFEVETRSETQAKVTIRLSGEAVAAALAHELEHLQGRARVPGFRPGKVPRGLLEKRFGDSLVRDIRRRLVADAFQEGITQQKLHPVDLPELKEEDLAPKQDGSVAVDLELEVIPHVEPTGFEKVAVTPPPFELKEEDVDRELEGLRRQAAQADPIDDGLTASGDVVIADLTLQFLDGSSLPKFENRIVDTGAGLVDGVACEEAKTKFLGCRRGDVVQVPLKLPDPFPSEEHRGKTAVTACTVKDLRRVVLPELSSPEFHAKVGAKDLDDLRAKMRERLKQMLRSEQNRAIEELCVDALIERHPFALPAGFLKRSLDAERERMREELTSRGAAQEQVERHLLEVEGRLRADVERRLRESHLLDRVADKLETSVSALELEQQFGLMARAWQVEPSTLIEQFREKGLVPRVVQDIRRAKVRRQLREAATTSENHARTSDPPSAAENAT